MESLDDHFRKVMGQLGDLPDDATDEQVRTREQPVQGDEQFWSVYERMRGEGCTPKAALAHAYMDLQRRL